MPLPKGFLIANQKVSINVALNGKINGYTELTIVPTAGDLKVIWLHARHLTILSASLRALNNIPLTFSHLPPTPPVLSDPNDIHTYPELKRAVWKATCEGEEGELGIAIPHGSVVKVPQAETVRTPATPKEEAKREDEWEQFVVAIEYEVTGPVPGVIVVGPDEANPSRFPHVFTSASSDTAARTWIPCSDLPRDRCTWDLELIVPRLLYSGSAGRAAAVDGDEFGAPDDDEDQEEWPISVVASGELVEQVVHPDRSDRVIWHYAQATPVSVHHIAWAVGPFVISEIVGTPKEKERETADDVDEDEDEDAVKDEGTKLHALCLPGREVEMAHSVHVIRQAMDYYTANFGSYPFTSYTVAFIDSLASGSPTFHSAGMTLFSADVLHPPSIIDQAYETRHLLAHALAAQWSGINIVPKWPADVWLTTGIALHMTSLFLRHLWGNNEYRFRLKKDMIRCVKQDVQREPISVPARRTEPDAEQLQFIALKAPLVLHILDKHLRKSGTSLGLDKVLPKLFLDAIAGDLGTGANYNTLGTSSFQRTCRKACGGSAESLKTFFDQWIFGSGCPSFRISAMFNRKKMAVELNVTQDCLAYNWAQTAPWEEAGHLRPIPLFEGQMTIRIHEADGTPYEHVLNIQDSYKRHEVPFNTKYKRIRRNTKRYQARQAAATAAASGDAEAQEDIGMMDVGFSLTLWEDEAERDKWRVADWTEEDDSVMSQATYEWIRIDADLEWICSVQFEQNDFMWLSQLQRDRDIVAQLEAVHALSRMPSAIVSSNLAKTVLVTNYFFRIRMEAALALISCATEDKDYLGLFHLFKVFQTRYCFEPEEETMDPLAFRCIPKTNDFRDLTEYFLKKTLVTAISMVRDKKGQTPPVVQQFLVDLLAYNDNLGNQYSDTYYLTAVMAALGHSFVAVAPREASGLTQETYDEGTNNPYLSSALEEVNRYMSTDRLVPSYHNAITIAGIEFKVKLTMASLIPEDRMSFFVYTRDGNYPPVRIAAFDALLLLNPLNDEWPLVKYLFSVLREDSSLLVQRRLAEAILQSLPVLAAIHDLAAPEMVFEEEGVTRKGGNDPLFNTLKWLRKNPGRSLNFRQCMLQTMIHPGIDPEVRACVLKICESTVKPASEALKKVVVEALKKIRIPSRAPSFTIENQPLPSPVGFQLKLTSSQSTSGFPKITLPSRSEGYSPLPASVEPIEEYAPHYEPEEPLPPPPPSTPKKVKIKAPPKVELSQSSGMSMSDVTACKSILKKLLKDGSSLLFRAPVDPVKSGAPGYFDIIENPMDLSSMHANLQAGKYADRPAFREDFKLIISNAILYNVSGPVVDQAHRLESIFEKAWNRVEATMRALGGSSVPKAHKAVAPPPPDVYEEAWQEPEQPPYEFAIPALPTPTISFKMSSSEYDFPPPPSPAPAPHPPTPSSDPVKPQGFKITLGGSSVSAAPPPPPPPAPTPVALPKIKKIKTVKTTSFSDSLSYAEPAYEPPYEEPPYVPPAEYPYDHDHAGSSVKAEPSYELPVYVAPHADDVYNAYDDGGYVPPPPSPPPKVKKEKHHSKDKEKKEKKHKDKGKEREREREREVVYEEPFVPEVVAAPVAPVVHYPGRPEVLDSQELPHPSRWLKGSDPVDVKKAKSVLSKMKAMREAFFFQQPVDPTGGLDDYYHVVKHPMDLQTMTIKVERGDMNYEELFADFDLIVSNCKLFNPPDTEPVWYVDVLDRAWRSEWERASKLSYNVKRSLLSFLKTLMQDGSAFPFLESVDTIIDQIPTYYDIIEFGNQRDLGTIKKHLETDKYTSIEQVEADVYLMLENCFAFNAPENQVFKSGEELQKLFRVGIAKIKADGSKGLKRAGEKSAGGTTKKQRL